MISDKSLNSVETYNTRGTAASITMFEKIMFADSDLNSF